MVVELRVIGEDEAAIAADLGFLAKEFGVTPGDVAFERISQDTVVGVATGERL